MKNKIMRKILFIATFSILCLCSCINKEKANFNYTREEQLEKEIETNLKSIAELTGVTSSNPLDYQKNEYYKNIVKLGNDAVPVLESMYKRGKLSRLNAYLSALIIEDITDCNLYEKYNLKWENASEFYTLWENNNCSFKK